MQAYKTCVGPSIYANVSQLRIVDRLLARTVQTRNIRVLKESMLDSGVLLGGALVVVELEGDEEQALRDMAAKGSKHRDFSSFPFLPNKKDQLYGSTTVTCSSRWRLTSPSVRRRTRPLSTPLP